MKTNLYKHNGFDFTELLNNEGKIFKVIVGFKGDRLEELREFVKEKYNGELCKINLFEESTNYYVAGVKF